MPDGDSAWGVDDPARLTHVGVSVKDYIERILDESDRRYEQRFVALTSEFRLGLQAQKEAVDMAFGSSAKAIDKAEIAQREYNARSNEFRAQLDDQAKRLMPRDESSVRFDVLEQRIAAVQATSDAKLEVLRVNTEKIADGHSADIADVRNQLTARVAARAGLNEFLPWMVATASALFAIIKIVTGH